MSSDVSCHVPAAHVSMNDMRTKPDPERRLGVEAGQASLKGLKEENEDCTGVRMPDDNLNS